MHERVSDASALVFGQHADRTQTQRRPIVDVSTRAHDMTEQPVIGDSDQGQPREPAISCAQALHELGLQRLGRVRDPPKRRNDDGVDCVDVSGCSGGSACGESLIDHADARHGLRPPASLAPPSAKKRPLSSLGNLTMAAASGHDATESTRKRNPSPSGAAATSLTIRPKRGSRGARTRSRSGTKASVSRASRACFCNPARSDRRETRNKRRAGHAAGSARAMRSRESGSRPPAVPRPRRPHIAGASLPPVGMLVAERMQDSLMLPRRPRRRRPVMTIKAGRRCRGGAWHSGCVDRQPESVVVRSCHRGEGRM